MDKVELKQKIEELTEKIRGLHKKESDIRIERCRLEEQLDKLYDEYALVKFHKD